MIVFLDTEFTDLLHPRLISVGLVSACGRHAFCGETDDYAVKDCSDFVRAAVLPLLDGGAAACSTAELGRRLLAWLERIRDGEDVLILVDYAPDWTLLFAAIGEVPRWLEATVTLQVNALALEAFFARPGVRRHRALDDAWALRHGWLAAQEAG